MEVSLFFSSFTGSSFNFADNLPVVATFLTTLTRNLTTATHGRFIVAHVWRAQSVMAGMSWYQEHEGVGHITSTVRTQRERNAAVAQFTLSFVCCQGPHPRGCIVCI